MDTQAQASSSSHVEQTHSAPSLVKFQALYQQLTDLQNSANPETISNEWATSYGIYQTLASYLNDIAHFPDPNSFSIYCPLVEDPVNRSEGLIIAARLINGSVNLAGEVQENGYFQIDGGNLQKPIVMILNTAVVEVSSSIDGQESGGSHWVTVVILPKDYTPPCTHQPLGNPTAILYFIDPMKHNAEVNPDFIGMLTNGYKYSITTDDTKQTIPRQTHASFPGLEYLRNPSFKQQQKGFDCGWWAVYNALMLVMTGSNDFLSQFQELDRAKAYKLRSIFPDLALEDRKDSKNKDKNRAPAVANDSAQASSSNLSPEAAIVTNTAEPKNPKSLYNFIATASFATGSLLFTLSMGQISEAARLALLVTGSTLGGIGLLPKIVVDIADKYALADKETKIYTEIKQLEEKLRTTVAQDCHLSRSKTGVLCSKILSAVADYATVSSIAYLLLSGTDTAAIRFGLSIGSVAFMGAMRLLNLFFETRAKKNQIHLETALAKLKQQLAFSENSENKESEHSTASYEKILNGIKSKGKNISEATIQNKFLQEHKISAESFAAESEQDYDVACEQKTKQEFILPANISHSRSESFNSLGEMPEDEDLHSSYDKV